MGQNWCFEMFLVIITCLPMKTFFLPLALLTILLTQKLCTMIVLWHIHLNWCHIAVRVSIIWLWSNIEFRQVLPFLYFVKWRHFCNRSTNKAWFWSESKNASALEEPTNYPQQQFKRQTTPWVNWKISIQGYFFFTVQPELEFQQLVHKDTTWEGIQSCFCIGPLNCLAECFPRET